MINVDKVTHRLLTYLLYIVFTTGYIVILAGQQGSPLYALIIYTIILVLTVVNHLKYYSFETVNPKGKRILILNMLLMFGVIYHDFSNLEQLFLLILVGDCIFAYSVRFSMAFIGATYAIYYPFIFWVYSTRNGWNFFDEFLGDIVASIFCIIILYLTKSQSDINVKYNDLLEKRDSNYQKLQAYSNEIEKLAIVEERNRIALVLHNSIGHSLTSIMLALQAEKMELVSKNQIDEEAFQMVEGLIQDAMSLLRKTIENADDFMNDIQFDDLMDIFIREASNNAKLNISYEAVRTDRILDNQKSVIFNLVLESITNAMKHSSAQHIHVSFKGMEEWIEVSIVDDGCGFDTIEYGFGIRKIIEQIEGLNGSYEILSKNGCQINVRLPYEEGED